jgi:hypothetical protein
MVRSKVGGIEETMMEEEAALREVVTIVLRRRKVKVSKEETVETMTLGIAALNLIVSLNVTICGAVRTMAWEVVGLETVRLIIVGVVMENEVALKGMAAMIVMVSEEVTEGAAVRT